MNVCSLSQTNCQNMPVKYFIFFVCYRIWSGKLAVYRCNQLLYSPESSGPHPDHEAHRQAPLFSAPYVFALSLLRQYQNDGKTLLQTYLQQHRHGSPSQRTVTESMTSLNYTAFQLCVDTFFFDWSQRQLFATSFCESVVIIIMC